MAKSIRVILLAVCALASAAAQTVTVDLKAAAPAPLIGAGVQWDPYEYEPSEAGWKTTFARLDYMRLGIFRVMLNANSYCLGFDQAGKPRYAWTEGQLDRLKSLFRILDYAQSHGIDVMLGEWSAPRGLGDPAGNRIAGPQDPRWAQIAADFAKYLLTERKYTVIKYYNLTNEPNGGWMWPGGKVDYDAWAASIRNLRSELDSRGLRKLFIAGPDNSGSWDWIDRCAREFPDRFGAWEMHWYAKDSDVLNGEIEKLLVQKREMLLKTDPGALAKPRFMGEAGLIEGKMNGDQQPRVKTFEYGVIMADYFAQVARAGWQGAIAWDLDDAMHAVSGRHKPVPPDDITLKIWGFWNTQGTAMGKPEDEAIRPWFYTWSLMSRLFPNGARVVNAAGLEETRGARALAASWTNGSGRQLSVMLVNDSDEARKITVRAPGTGKKTLTRYRYFDKDRPVDRDGYPAPSGTGAADLEAGITVELPSRGVAFLSTAR